MLSFTIFQCCERWSIHPRHCRHLHSWWWRCFEVRYCTIFEWTMIICLYHVSLEILNSLHAQFVLMMNDFYNYFLCIVLRSTIFWLTAKHSVLWSIVCSPVLITWRVLKRSEFNWPQARTYQSIIDWVLNLLVGNYISINRWWGVVFKQLYCRQC